MGELGTLPGGTFLWNVGSNKENTAPHLRRRHSSYTLKQSSQLQLLGYNEKLTLTEKLKNEAETDEDSVRYQE
jgi:hypothetical protein